MRFAESELSYFPWYGWLVVDSTHQLNIQAGTKVHFHQNAGMWVYRYGTLKVNGALNNEVIFQGDRLEPYMQDVPGQWDRIWINEGSVNNEINYAIIKNGFIGLQAELLFGNFSEPRRLSITNTKINKMQKVLAIAFIAATMVACNNKSDKKAEEVKDTAAKMMDDASKMMDTANKMMDTAAKMVDTAASKMQ